MSILLVFCVLAAAGWLVLSVISRDPTDDPGDSVAAHSRAMAALNPTGKPRRARPVSRHARRRAPGSRGARPAGHGRSRPETAAARSRVSHR